MGFISISIKKDTLFHSVHLVRKLYGDKSVIKWNTHFMGVHLLSFHRVICCFQLRSGP